MLHSFLHDRAAMTCFVILAVLVLSAFAAPIIAPHDPYDSTTINIMDAQVPPTWSPGGDTKFLLGTDAQGRDMLSTMLYGMRVSIIIGVGAVCLQAFIGIIVGLLSGYIKRLDNILMRIADVQLSFSPYMVAIFIGAIIQTAFGVAGYDKVAVPLIIVIIGLAEWPQYAKAAIAKRWAWELPTSCSRGG